MKKRPKSSKTKASTHPKPIMTFDYTMEITVIEPVFEPSSSLNLLDISRLTKGKHKVEVGLLKGACCTKPIRVVIEKGLAVRFEVEPCRDSRKLATKEVTALFAHAAKKLGPVIQWEPLPVEDFFKGVMAREINVGTGAGCFWICISDWCLFCCKPFVTQPPSPYIDCWIETRKADLLAL
jgi:hypothetical protein